MLLPVPEKAVFNVKKGYSNDLTGKFLNSRDIQVVNDNSLLSSALYYASLSIPVFPTHSMIDRDGILRCSCKQAFDCNFSGKHPKTRKGYKDATTKSERIREWWSRYPDANIGLATGKRSGFFVVDIDIKHGGDEAFEAMQDDYRYLLKSDYEPIPPTLIAKTGSGGFHYYFKYPADVSIKTSSSQVRLGIDIRSDGGYVLAPPSNHKSGKNYGWWLSDIEIYEAPNWLIKEILEADEESASTNTWLKPTSAPRKLTGEVIEKGNRNSFLFTYGCGLVNSFSPQEVATRISEINEFCCSPPLSEREVSHILKNIEGYRDRK